MLFQAVRWLDSKPFNYQIVALALVFDPLGAALGYALHPQLGVDPIVGIALGLVAGSVPTSLWVLRHAQRQG